MPASFNFFPHSRNTPEMPKLSRRSRHLLTILVFLGHENKKCICAQAGNFGFTTPSRGQRAEIKKPSSIQKIPTRTVFRVIIPQNYTRSPTWVRKGEQAPVTFAVPREGEERRGERVPSSPHNFHFFSPRSLQQGYAVQQVRQRRAGHLSPSHGKDSSFGKTLPFPFPTMVCCSYSCCSAIC